MNRSSDVVVIGAGIVGVSCALELARRGIETTVVDRGAVGYGCSYGNAGWLTPCYATPLAAPGMFVQALKWMLDDSSPFYIRPEPSWTLLRWLAGFAAATRRDRFEKSVGALVPLSAFSLRAYEAEAAASGDGFGFVKSGQLTLGQTAAGLAHAVEDGEQIARHGIAMRVLSEAELRRAEPAIVGAAAGGVFFPDEAHVEPLATAQALAAAAERAGATIATGTEVFDFEVAGGRIKALRTTRGVLEAGRVVLATGSWSMALGEKLGLRIPVLGGKGYAVITPSVSPMPRTPIRVVERKIAITPRATTVRLSGTLELVNGDESVSPRRVEAIVRSARSVLNLPERPIIEEVWRGLRPCTPDGLPIIGFSPRHTNLLLVTGHQMLGLHTAPGTARLAADLLTGNAPSFDPAPFRADRF